MQTPKKLDLDRVHRVVLGERGRGAGKSVAAVVGMIQTAEMLPVNSGMLWPIPNLKHLAHISLLIEWVSEELNGPTQCLDPATRRLWWINGRKLTFVTADDARHRRIALSPWALVVETYEQDLLPGEFCRFLYDVQDYNNLEVTPVFNAAHLMYLAELRKGQAATLPQTTE